MSEKQPTPSASPYHTAEGKWAPGHPPPPGVGRPKGSRPAWGRRRVLETLDKVVGSDAAQRLFLGALEDRMKEDPLDFMQKFVFPMLPRETLQSVDTGEGKAAVRIMGLEGVDVVSSADDVYSTSDAGGGDGATAPNHNAHAHATGDGNGNGHNGNSGGEGGNGNGNGHT